MTNRPNAQLSETVGPDIIQALAAFYVPRSGMCQTCKKLSFVTDCARLPFHTMKVIKVYGDGTHAVMCSHYERAPK